MIKRSAEHPKLHKHLTKAYVDVTVINDEEHFGAMNIVLKELYQHVKNASWEGTFHLT